MCPLICQSLTPADAPPGEKPKGIKTHLRNMLIVPEMIGSIVGIYNGEISTCSRRQSFEDERQPKHSHAFLYSLRPQ